MGADGAALEYFERGHGEPVVLVHGAPSDCRLWRPHVAGLSDSRRVIAYTQRYFGRSEWRSDWLPFGIRTHTDDLLAVLRAVAAGPAHVVAWSYGAHVALMAAHEEPDMFRSLFAYEPGVPTYVTDSRELAEFSADAERMFGPVFAAVQRGDYNAGVAALIDGSGQAEGYFEAQSPERRLVQLDSARVLPLLLSQPPPPPLSFDDLRRLRVPVTVAWGERTRLFFGVVSRAAANCIGGGHAIAGATHMWPEERPRELVDRMQRYLGPLTEQPPR